MAKYNFYKIREAYGWGPGVTQRRHIADIYGKQPMKFAAAAHLVWGANNQPNIMSFIDKYASVKEFPADEEYTWDLMFTPWKNYALVEARAIDGSIIAATDGSIGQGGEPFQLVFAEQPFAYGEMIVGEKNSFYQFKIIEEPISEGTNTVYTVQLMAGAETGCPAEDLVAGKLFSMEFSPVESELSRRVGGIRKAVTTRMRNEWTTLRKYMKFTGKADKQLRLDVDIPVMRDGKPTVVKTWFDNEMWIFQNEWEAEKARAFAFSRSNRNSNGNYFNFGDSGNAIKEGDGLFAQMMYGHTVFYNDMDDQFSIKGLADSIYELCEINNVPISERKFVIATGSRGMIQVNNSIKKETAGFGMNLEYDATSMGVIQKTSSNVHQNALAYGAQFVEYRGANGLVLTFVLEPSFDDRVRNKIMGPNGRGVLMSYAYMIMDMGTKQNPNIYKCKLQGDYSEDQIKYILGMRNPFGINHDNVISHDEDSSEIHIMTTVGACIIDPTRCMMYLPAGLCI